ncbi:MAG: cobalt-precorrin-6A reductase [Paracoccaceae bacterium]
MLLLLAGTGQARVIAQRLAAADIPSIATLAGVTREPARLAIKTVTGGFGGAAGFEQFLRQHKISAILDATHPFADAISHRSQKIAAQKGLPYKQVLRPAWVPGAGDCWTMIASEIHAAEHIPTGATVFLATGRQTLPRFDNLSGRHLICRQIDPPDGPFPFENGQFLVGRPPFSVADEIALFERLEIDWLVVKNAGGQASYTKLAAAATLGIPVAMIKRPKQPQGTPVQTIKEALAWVEKTIC